jgi:hypothetical protein
VYAAADSTDRLAAFWAVPSPGLFMPGDRTCSGGAYTFQIPGSLAAQDNVAIPLKVQNAASIRCVYAYLQQGTNEWAVSLCREILDRWRRDMRLLDQTPAARDGNPSGDGSPVTQRNVLVVRQTLELAVQGCSSE